MGLDRFESDKWKAANLDDAQRGAPRRRMLARLVPTLIGLGRQKVYEMLGPPDCDGPDDSEDAWGAGWSAMVDPDCLYLRYEDGVVRSVQVRQQ